MVDVFKTVLRKIGHSYGVLIPKAIVKKEKLKLKEKVRIALLKKKKSLVKYFGIARDFKKDFGRDKSARMF